MHFATWPMALAWIGVLSAAADDEPKTPTVLWKVPITSASFGCGAAADVNGDGKVDVAFATYFGDSRVLVRSGADGSELWTHDAASKPGAGDACLDASCKFCDLDGDGKLELIVPISNRSEVLCFDAAKGTVKWKYEAGLAECIDTPPLVEDLDGDGRPEIVVGTFKSKYHVIKADGTLLKALKVAPAFVQSCPVAGKLGEGGVLGLIAGNFRGDNAFHAVALADGAELWKVQTGSFIYHGVCEADLNADGKMDYIGASYDGKVYAFDALGKEIWTKKPGDFYFMSPAASADVDADGKPEVIIASEKVTVFRADGSTMWSLPASDGGNKAVTRGVSIADLDGDGKPDVAYADGAGRFRVRRGFDGELLFAFDGESVVGKPVISASHGPIIADFNGDGVLDVFYVAGQADSRGGGGKGGDGYGMGICLTGFAGKGRGWPMHRHDLRNTGRFEAPAK